MSFLFAIRRILLFPFEMVRAIVQFVTDIQNGTPRQQAAFFGIPSVVIALAGLAVLMIASSNRETATLERYKALASSTNAKFLEKLNVYARKTKATADKPPTLNAEKANDNELKSTDTPVATDEITQLQSELVNLRKEEILYLEKMIKMQPGNDEFKFRHAQAFRFLDNQQMMELTSALAPENGVGYPEAHLLMAKYFQDVAARNPPIRQKALLKALNHADNCLVSQKDNLDALLIRGQALYQLNRYEQAYSTYSTIVDRNPNYFATLLELNNLRGVTGDENNIVLQNSRNELSKKLKRVRNDLPEWEATLFYYVDCLSRIGDFETIRSELETERSLIEPGESNQIKNRIVDRLLAKSLVVWTDKLLPADANQQTSVDAFKNVIASLNEAKTLAADMNELIVRTTYLMVRYPQLTDELKKVYDPDADPNPPYFVLAQLGASALLKENFSEAISYLERARNLTPNDPEILNNLAYAYLSSKTGDAKRALYLSELAFKAAESTSLSKNLVYMSGLRHTHGTALMALERYSEAAGFFQDALSGRPDNVGILEALIICYEKVDPKQVEVYKARLEEVKRKNPASPGKQ